GWHASPATRTLATTASPRSSPGAEADRDRGSASYRSVPLLLLFSRRSLFALRMAWIVAHRRARRTAVVDALTRAGAGWPRVRRVDCWRPCGSYGSRSIAIGRTSWRARRRPRTLLRLVRP